MTKDLGHRLKVSASAVSRLPFERLELIYNGEILAEQPAWKQREAKIERQIRVARGGWIAARVSGGGKTHAGSTVFAHTSPLYVRVPETPHRQAESAGSFVDEIEASKIFIRKNFRFAKDADRALALGRFEDARKVFSKLASEG